MWTLQVKWILVNVDPVGNVNPLATMDPASNCNPSVNIDPVGNVNWFASG